MFADTHLQVRAKAVLERDLEHLREKSAIEQPLMPPATSQNDLNDLFREQSIMFPDGRSQKTDFAASAKAEATRRIQDPNQPSTATPMLSPPSSDKLAGSINPAGASSLDSAATTLSTTQESLDSLLGMTAGGTEKNQVSSKDSAFPTQTQDDSQALKIMANSKELDLKDPLKPPSSGGETVATSKADALDDLLSFSNDRSGGDDLDLDLPMGMKEGEDSVFDDIFFAGEDGIGGAEELEHGQFDNAYFGIDD